MAGTGPALNPERTYSKNVSAMKTIDSTPTPDPTTPDPAPAPAPPV
ncbi:hypothetical protein ACFXPY_42455 [Streptomyces sp. NPDC059153]